MHTERSYKKIYFLRTGLVRSDNIFQITRFENLRLKLTGLRNSRGGSAHLLFVIE